MPKNLKGREVAEIMQDKCIACQICIGVCPVGAISMEGNTVKINPEACIGCGKCRDVCPVSAVLFKRPSKKKLTFPQQKPAPLEDYKGVAVFIETHNGAAADVSWELAGKARELADKLGVRVSGYLAGAGVEPLAQQAISYGCDDVYMIDNPAFGSYIPRVYSTALVQLCRQSKPEILLIGASPLGRDLAPCVATLLETGLTADCTGLDVDLQERLLLMTRPTFGGNIMATIFCKSHRPQMSTVRPRLFKAPRPDPTHKGEIHKIDFSYPPDRLPHILEFTATALEAGAADITRSPVLVTIGKGACRAEHVPMFQELADMLGGTIACSRPVVEAGLMSYARQVGQTGKTVTPKIYIGIGVSGSMQHMAGIQGAETIVAINSDPAAPIVQAADYSLIGDYREIVPALISRLKNKVANLAGSKP